MALKKADTPTTDVHHFEQQYHSTKRRYCGLQPEIGARLRSFAAALMEFALSAGGTVFMSWLA
jgi:hypothetical protein